MKKNIILLVLCAVLLLIFTSSGYGAFDPNYLEREEADPWDRQLCPRPDGDKESGFLVLTIGWDVCLVFRTPVKMANVSNSQGSNSQRLGTSQLVGQACP